MFPLIWDMGGESGYPIQHEEHLEVLFEDWVHRGLVDDSLALGLISQLLLGEGGAKERLSSRAPPGLILTAAPALGMDAEPRRRPTQALLDQRVVAPPLPPEHQ